MAWLSDECEVPSVVVWVVVCGCGHLWNAVWGALIGGLWVELRIGSRSGGFGSVLVMRIAQVTQCTY